MIALIFINYNVQLGLSQVALSSLINRTEIVTASISILLFQFCCYLVFVMSQILFCFCNFNSVVLNSILFVQFFSECLLKRIFKLYRFYITEFETGFWQRWPLISRVVMVLKWSDRNAESKPKNNLQRNNSNFIQSVIKLMHTKILLTKCHLIINRWN